MLLSCNARAGGGGSPALGRGTAVHGLRGPSRPGRPSRSGAAVVVRAAAGAFETSEWELYRAENFHLRTVQLMREISRTLKQEWELYRAEGLAQLVRQAHRQQQAAAAQTLVQVAEAVVAEGVISVDEADVAAGYHPTRIGEKFKDGRYTVMHKLGQGHYSIVWMVRDEHTGQQAAMKIVKSMPNYTQAARDEVALLNLIRDIAAASSGESGCVKLLDAFEHPGPEGCHVCEIFEIMGDDLLMLMRLYEHRGIPIDVVRHLAQQTLQALDYLHTQCEIVHLDIKPENCVLTEPVAPRGVGGLPSLEQVDLDKLEPRLLQMGCKIVDFGNAVWIHGHPLPEEVQTQHYRAPEVLLGAGYHDSADMWSLACMVFELVTGDLLFNPREQQGVSEEQNHMAQMVELLGPPPTALLERGKYSHDYFGDDGRLLAGGTPSRWPLEELLQEKYGLPAEEAVQLKDFLMPMLDFDPDRRASAAEMLQHPWLNSGESLQRSGRRGSWAELLSQE